MKHSHLFLALLFSNTVMYTFVLGTFDMYVSTVGGQGVALFLHWAFNRVK